MLTKYKKLIIIIGNLILVLIWMTSVFILSNQNATESQETSSGFIELIVKLLNSDINVEELAAIIEKVQFVARKAAHLILYIIGGMLIYNLMQMYDLNKKLQVIIASSVGIVYAITDEIHQYFIPGRSAEIRDVCIDGCGIIIGIFLVTLFKNVINKSCEK